MSPKTMDNYVGIEVECWSNHSLTEVRQVIRDYGYNEYIQVGTDSSIECDCHPKTIPYYYSTWDNGRYVTSSVEQKVCGCKEIELRMLSTESNLKQSLLGLKRVLKDIDAKVNKSCGLHVHLDMRNRSMLQCADKLYNVQELLYHMVHSGRAKGTYARKISKIDSAYELANGDHYNGINTAAFKEHKTIEIRMHEGTVNMLDVYQWCRFLIEVINKDIIKPTDDVSIFTVRTKKYIMSRIKMKDDMKDKLAQKII